MKHPDPIRQQHRNRLLVISSGILILLSLLMVQFYKIQISQAAHWDKIARRQHFFEVNEPFKRGTFYSNGSIKRAHPDEPQKLVLDIQKFHLLADPSSIAPQYKEEIAKALQTHLGLSNKQTTKLLVHLKKKSRSRRLVLWLEPDTKEAILTWWQPFAKSHRIPRNALYFVADYQRSYPYGKLLGQVLQTVQQKRDEKTGQAEPTGGLELALDKWLRGQKGRRRLMRSPRNALEMDEVIAPPENGADVYLTINPVLQAIAEDEVAKAVKRTNAKAGWAVMMDPHSGEILALAQYPFFYPARYPEYFNDPDRRQETKVQAVSDAQEPGSVMKPITLAVALMANKELARLGKKPLFTIDEKIATFDGHFPGRKPLKEITYHQYLNMNMALQKSSNIYMARLTQRIIDQLGTDWYRAALHDVFGLGRKTGIELPGESAGLLPTPGKMHPSGALEWSVPTPFSLAIGHNVQATSLQLVRAYALFANGGYFVQPTLLRKVEKKNGDGSKTVFLDQTEANRKLSFPQLLDLSTIQAVVTAMKYVTKPGGSAHRADVPGYTEAGKTGSAEKIVNGTYSHDDHVSSFIGFTPVTNPAFVLLVTIDEPEKGYIPGVGKRHLGSYAAAPAFREIAKRSLAYLGVPPDDPYGYSKGDPRHDPLRADWTQEVEKLRQQYDQWNHKS